MSRVARHGEEERKGEGGGADRRGQAARERRRWPLRAGPEVALLAGPSRVGPRGKERGSELGRPAWAGSRDFGLFWVWVLFPLYFSFLILSLTQAQLFEFKRNFEFKPL